MVAIDRGRTPASHFTFPDLLEIAGVLREALADPTIDGAVVVQGTDTIEETAFCWDLVLDGAKPVVVTGAMRASDEAGFDGPANLRDCGPGRGRPVDARRRGRRLPGRDRSSRRTTWSRCTPRRSTRSRSPNGGSLGRVGGGRGRRSSGGARAGGMSRPTRAAERVQLITATVAMDGSLLDAARRGRRRRDRRRGDRRREHGSAAAGRRGPGDRGRASRSPSPRAVRRVGPARPTRSRVAARRGSGRVRSRSVTCARSRPGSRWRSGSGPAWTATGSRRSSPTRYPDDVPLDTLITGRIATLAGDDGFGWVEAIGIRDGRVAFAGSEVDLETRADPFTERIALEPDEVAIPGLTDAHLHLAQARAVDRARST